MAVNLPHDNEPLEDSIKRIFISLMTQELLPGARKLSLNEIYTMDIPYYLKLVDYYHNKPQKSKQVFVDLVGI